MLIPFTKMQAQGNDFVILNLLGQTEVKYQLDELAEDVCEPAFGIGADGLVALLDDSEADARMLIYNSDGSRAAMCGSALRCCAQLLGSLLDKTELTLNTDSGLKAARLESTPAGDRVCVNLGQPRMLNEEASLNGLRGCLVDVGNLHYVTFWDDLQDQHLVHGEAIEKNHPYDRGVNSQFVEVISRQEILMNIWENGAGPTLACGTGAVASVFCGCHKGQLAAPVTVTMPGGTVLIDILEDGSYTLAGEVETVFNGVYRWKI